MSPVPYSPRDYPPDRDEYEDPRCPECGSTDLSQESLPGMAGWESPIVVTTCDSCKHEVTIELAYIED